MTTIRPTRLDSLAVAAGIVVLLGMGAAIGPTAGITIGFGACGVTLVAIRADEWAGSTTDPARFKRVLLVSVFGAVGGSIVAGITAII